MSRYRGTITRLRATTTQDPRSGDEVPDWATAQESDPIAASVQPASTSELTDRRQVAITRWTVLAEPADILPTDRVRYLGQDYDVDGEVGSFPGSRLDHLEFTIKRTG